jgi:chaperonin GroES
MDHVFSPPGNRMSLQVKEGDRILFGKYSGTEIKVEGEDYLMMREEDILGIIEG